LVLPWSDKVNVPSVVLQPKIVMGRFAIFLYFIG
jgi:hypothetical protein